MNRSEISNAIKEIILNIMEDEGLEDFEEDADFAKDLQIDSLQAVSILIHTEKQFKVKLPQDELVKFTNLKSVVDLVETKLVGIGS